MVQVRYITIKPKELARVGYNGFLFPHLYSAESQCPKYECRKRNPVYPIWDNSFFSIVCFKLSSNDRTPTGQTHQYLFQS